MNKEKMREEVNTIVADLGPIYQKGYGRLYNYHFFDRRLDNAMRAVFVYFCALLPSNGEPRVWPGIADIQEKTGTGIHQIQKAINDLEAIDFIKREKIQWRKKDNRYSYAHNRYEIIMKPKNFKLNPNPHYREYKDVRDYGYRDLPVLPIWDPRTGSKEIIMWGLISLLTPQRSMDCVIDERLIEKELGLSANPVGKRIGQQYRALEILQQCGYISFGYEHPRKSNDYHGRYFVHINNERKKTAQKSTIEDFEKNEKTAQKSTIEDSKKNEKTAQKSTVEKSTEEKSTITKKSYLKHKIIEINQSGKGTIVQDDLSGIDRLIAEDKNFLDTEKKVLNQLLEAIQNRHGSLILRGKEYTYDWLAAQMNGLTDSEIVDLFKKVLEESSKHRIRKDRIGYLLACIAGKLESFEREALKMIDCKVDYNALVMQDLVERLQD